MHRPAVRATFVAIVALLSHSLLASESTFQPNSTKYKDSGIQASKGRSGSAAIEARVLLNQNGSADVDVTTGSFDSSAAAPGTIAKVQLAVPAGATRNFNGLDAGGTFTTNIGGVVRGNSVGVQANVRGIDARTDVVTVAATAGKRPDLAVSGVTPETTVRGLDTNVRATIQELNGDHGARANCVLYVEGSEADRADGIWVDAGGTVQCAFVTKFASAGIANISVALEQVNPGDWNNENNSMALAVTVTNPPETFRGSIATVREEEFTTYDYTKDADFREETRETNGVTQTLQYRAFFRTDLTHSNLSMRVVTESDGQLVADTTSNGPWTRLSMPWMQCSILYSNPEVVACNDFDSGVASIEYTYGTGDATYRSRGWATRDNPWAPTVPRYEWNRTTVENNLIARFGSTVNMRATVEDGGTTYEGEVFIPSLRTRTRVSDRPYGCYYDDYIGITTCTESHSVRTTRNGSASQ
jgi:hypothetical protein